MSVGSCLDLFISQLKDENRLGYAESFKGLKSSLLLYCKSLDIKFSAIDNQWLKGYEIHLKKGGKGNNTIGIRFRSLRALYNKAIADEVVKRDYYPFETFKISKFREQTKKRAIKREDIKRIIDLDVRTITNYRSPYLELGRDLFIFSYLSYDERLLKYELFQYYHREKFQSTDTQPIKPTEFSQISQRVGTQLSVISLIEVIRRSDPPDSVL